MVWEGRGTTTEEKREARVCVWDPTNETTHEEGWANGRPTQERVTPQHKGQPTCRWSGGSWHWHHSPRPPLPARTQLGKGRGHADGTRSGRGARGWGCTTGNSSRPHRRRRSPQPLLLLCRRCGTGPGNSTGTPQTEQVCPIGHDLPPASFVEGVGRSATASTRPPFPPAHGGWPALTASTRAEGREMRLSIIYLLCT